MKTYIKLTYYNPCAKEIDWCIISKENEETHSEELAMLFNNINEAKKWWEENKQEWEPCNAFYVYTK